MGNSKSKHKAIFFDRDGVLIEDTHLLSRKEDIRLIPHVFEICRDLKDAGFKLFIVSNQGTVPRGILTEEEAYKLHDEVLGQTKIKSFIDETLFCFHHPNATVLQYRTLCQCRKPHPGMIWELAKKWDIDLERSFLIGDRPSDIAAGKLAGVKTIWFQSGKHFDKGIESSLELSKRETTPDYIIQSLEELRGIIL